MQKLIEKGKCTLTKEVVALYRFGNMVIDGCASPRYVYDDGEFDINHRKGWADSKGGNRRQMDSHRLHNPFGNNHPHHGLGPTPIGRVRTSPDLGHMDQRIVGFGSNTKWDHHLDGRRQLQGRERPGRVNTTENRSSNPLGKMTPTERLRRRPMEPRSPARTRSHGKTRHGKTPNTFHSSRPSAARPRSADRKRRPVSSTKSRSTDHNVVRAPSRGMQRGRSFDMKHRRSEAFGRSHTHARERSKSKSPGRHYRVADVTDEDRIMQKKFDRQSRAQKLQPFGENHVPPSFGESRSRSAGRLLESRMNTSTPTRSLFAHAQRQADIEAKNQSILAKPYSSIATHKAVSDEVSEISAGFSELSSLKAPKQRSNEFSSKFSTLINSEPLSPTSIGSDGDRYTMFGDNNDSFDEAVRSRLSSRSKSPAVFGSEIPLTSESKFFPGLDSHQKQLDDNSKSVHSQSRLLNPQFKSSKPKPVVPGITIGQSRSFVDQVEDQLDAIKQKREGRDEETVGRNASGWGTNQRDGARLSGGTKSLAARMLEDDEEFGGSKFNRARGASIFCFLGSRKKDIATASDLQGTMVFPPPGRNNLKSGKTHRGWFRRKPAAGGGCVKVSQAGVTQLGGGSSKSGSDSSKSSRLLGRRGREGSIGSHESPYTNSVSTVGSDVISYNVVEHMTTFDSALHKPARIPQVEFGVVELGADEETELAHSTIVNRKEVQQQLTSNLPPIGENVASVANVRGVSDQHHKKASATSKKFISDDAILEDLKLTESFVDQLQRLKHLQQPPYKVPKGAYML